MKTTALEGGFLQKIFQLSGNSQAARLPLLVILSGILFTLFLQLYVQDGVYFSGDGGLKALLAQQFASGDLRFDLSLPAADWVKELWQGGLYPFLPPFVYERLGLYYITFPFTFPLVTAPFYALLGYRGLYVIPIVATWILWFRFYTVCKQLEVKDGFIAIALVALVFASPLSIYSAMYWEHTLAVALAFYGLTTVFFPRSALTTKAAVLGGVLIGLSVWFRPEFLCLIAGLLPLALIGKLRWFEKFSPASGKEIFFSISLLLSILVFFGINKIVYGHPLGIHSIQVVEDFSLKERLFAARDNFKQLTYSLFEYFPVLLFPSLFALLALFNQKLRLTPKIWSVHLITALFLCAVPLIVPGGAGGKQWGPRFLLILIPLLSLLSAVQLNSIREMTGRVQKYISMGLICTLIAVGIHLNIFVATANLIKDYKAVGLALTAVKQNSNDVIAISHQYVAQAIMPALSERAFFLIEDVEDVKQLSTALLNQGYQKFLYICYHHRPCPVPEESAQNLEFSSSNRSLKIEFSPLPLGSLGGSGRYPAYEGSILTSTQPVEP
jgi:hypothetical protein